MKKLKRIWALLFIIGLLCAYEIRDMHTENKETVSVETLEDIPTYAGEPYVVLNDNEPLFTEEDMITESYEYYSELDDDGKCGVVEASIGQDIMPTEERGSIGQVKPTGWQTIKYEHVDGKYLYNRWHNRFQHPAVHYKHTH